MGDFEKNLKKYAELAVKTAVNIQQGQTLVISAPLSASDFVHLITKYAYTYGANFVYVDWNDEKLTRLRYELAPEGSFEEFPLWKAKGFEEMAKSGAAFLTIYAPNPELLQGIDPNRIAIANKTAATALAAFGEYKKSDKVSWSIMSVPTKEWAQKIFPTFTEEEAIQKLWKVIFKMTRADQEDPVKAWKHHQRDLQEKLSFLNEKRFDKLHYKAEGTDLMITLPKDHVWIGGGSQTEQGVPFIPNVPTEEVFTLPMKDGVNGTVSSTKPLNYGGNIIENFTLTFKNGKIVSSTAEKGTETLEKLIETDEGSHYLGEIALVPHHSPISNSGLIFYNTLYDENASCHLAIGSAYPICLKDGTQMSKEELKERGANLSLTHVDFMIGSSTLSIDGFLDNGEKIPIFRNGNWAF